MQPVSHTDNIQFLAAGATCKKLYFPRSSDGKVLVGKAVRALVAWEEGT